MTYKIMIKLTYDIIGLATELNNNTMKSVNRVRTLFLTKIHGLSRITFLNFKNLIYYFLHRFDINYKNIPIVMGFFS